MFRDVTLLQANIQWPFYWLTPLADSFVNSDWLEFVIHFQTNEQGGEQSAFMVNLSENSV